MSEPLTEAALLRSLHDVQDPEFGKTLVELRMLKDAVLKDGNCAEVAVELPTPAYPPASKDKIAADIRAALSETFPELKSVDVKFPWKVKGKNTGGTIGLRVKNVVAVGLLSCYLLWKMSLHKRDNGTMYHPNLPATKSYQIDHHQSR
jgi:ATP-binding protein involved in chromosome partitioning